MATDRSSDGGHSATTPDRRARSGWLREAATWFAVSAAGMAVVFIGLAVDAYRHNNSGTVETLLSFSNPGHLTAAVGLAVASLAALTGLTLSALKDVSSVDHAVRRLAPVTATWVILAAIGVGSITYIGASGATVGGHGAATASSNASSSGTDTTAGEAGSIAAAVQSQGIDLNGATAPGSGSDAAAQRAASAPGALPQGAKGAANAGMQDMGKQPTFAQVESMPQSQLMPLFPANTLTNADFPQFKSQLDEVRQVALKFGNVEDAKKAGYVNTTNDVPYMGEHYLNYDILKKGIFDPSRPTGLLYSKIGPNGAEQLVGVWFLMIPGINGITRDVEPAGFAGNLDMWHAHVGLCLVGTASASQGETKESCAAKGGAFTADLRWMIHVWVAPGNDNPDGVLTYLNPDLFQKQQAAAKNTGAPSGSVQQ